jgi:hypothetical protein
MAKNSTPGVTSPVPSFEAVLSLLSVIVTRNGHTFSWYTSKKGRVWATLKGFNPTTYTTSAEAVQNAPDQTTLDTLLVMLKHHIPKLQGIEPPANTWLTTKQVSEELDGAAEWALDLYRRWQNGEMFWDGTYSAGHPDLRVVPEPDAS